MEVRLKVDTRQLRTALAQLGKDAPTAIMRGLNRTAASVRTQAVRAIAADLAIAQRRIRENVTLDKAHPAKLTAAVSATPGGAGVGTAQSKAERAGRIPILEFRARGPYPSRGRGTGVRYRLPTGKGQLRRAFIAVMRSGHKGVFTRLPSAGTASGLVARLKIVEIFGPSIPKVFANRRILDALLSKGEELLAKHMAHEIEYLTGRRGGRRG